MDADGFTTVRRSPAKSAASAAKHRASAAKPRAPAAGPGPGKPYVASAAKGMPGPGKPYVAPAAGPGKVYVASAAKAKPAPVTVACTECSKGFVPGGTSKYTDVCPTCIAHRQCVSCSCLTATMQCVGCGERVCAGCSLLRGFVVCGKCHPPPEKPEPEPEPVVETYVGFYNPARYGIVAVAPPSPLLSTVLSTESGKKKGKKEDKEEGEWLQVDRHRRKTAHAVRDDDSDSGYGTISDHD